MVASARQHSATLGHPRRYSSVAISLFFAALSFHLAATASQVAALNQAIHVAETNLNEALPLFQSVLLKEPQNEHALLGVGRCLIAQQQPVSAESAYKNALLYATTPETKDIARAGLVHCLVAQSRYVDAEATLGELVAEHPDDFLYRKLQGQIRLAQGKTREAYVAYECARRLGDTSEETAKVLEKAGM